MIMQYNQNGVTFSNVKFHQGAAAAIVPMEIGGMREPGLDDGTGIINVVDIDWNGAVLPDGNVTGGSVTINTTGQLLSLINDIQKEIYVLSAAVIAIGTR